MVFFKINLISFHEKLRCQICSRMHIIRFFSGKFFSSLIVIFWKYSYLAFGITCQSLCTLSWNLDLLKFCNFFLGIPEKSATNFGVFRSAPSGYSERVLENVVFKHFWYSKRCQTDRHYLIMS